MQRKKRALTLVEVLVAVLVIAMTLLAIFLLLPAKRGVREAARRNSCLNNNKQITLALLNYESAHGTFPPAYTVDAEGKRLHSWRTLILPYMEQTALFKSIDLTKPWNHPVNAKAREATMPSYQCPSTDLADGLTPYLAVVGPESAFSGSEPRKLEEITDGPGNTIFMVEVTQNHAVHWMSPHDVSFDRVVEYTCKLPGPHSGEIFVVAFLDGYVQALTKEIDPAILRGMLTIAGGEAVEE